VRARPAHPGCAESQPAERRPSAGQGWGGPHRRRRGAGADRRCAPTRSEDDAGTDARPVHYTRAGRALLRTGLRVFRRAPGSEHCLSSSDTSRASPVVRQVEDRRIRADECMLELFILTQPVALATENELDIAHPSAFLSVLRRPFAPSTFHGDGIVVNDRLLNFFELVALDVLVERLDGPPHERLGLLFAMPTLREFQKDAAPREQ